MNRGRRDRRVREQHVLDLCRIHVEAARNVEVLDAIGDTQVAGVVEPTDIAGVDPTDGIASLGGHGGIVAVARHHVVPAHDDLTRLSRIVRTNGVRDIIARDQTSPAAADAP